MDRQNKKLVLRINEDFKNKFQIKSDNEHMKMATRIKYLMQKDIDGKLIIK